MGRERRDKQRPRNSGLLVISVGDAPEVLEPTKAAFDDISAFARTFVEAIDDDTVRFFWGLRACAMRARRRISGRCRGARDAKRFRRESSHRDSFRGRKAILIVLLETSMISKDSTGPTLAHRDARMRCSSSAGALFVRPTGASGRAYLRHRPCLRPTR